MPLPTAGACHYHPMRPGIGVCVECRQVVCAECTTQFEGINRCAACLARMGRRAAGEGPRSDWRFGTLLGAAVVLGLLFGVASCGGLVLAP